MKYFKQCTLAKGTLQDTVWIPEEFAVLGKYLKIKEEDGWKVIKVGRIRESQTYLAQYSREYLDHRKVTDI